MSPKLVHWSSSTLVTCHLVSQRLGIEPLRRKGPEGIGAYAIFLAQKGAAVLEAEITVDLLHLGISDRISEEGDEGFLT